MPQRDELDVDVPFLGSANQDDDVVNTPEKQQQVVHSQKQSSHWFHSVLIFLLMLTVGAILYWGYDFNQDQQQRVLMNEATEARIADLEQLLSDFKAQAERSGQTLKEQLNQQVELVEAQKKIMDSQYQEYETKFANLITQSNSEQEKQIAKFNTEIEKLELKIKNAQEDAQDELGFMTSQQKKALASLEERLTELDGLRTSVTNLEIGATKTAAIQNGLVTDVELLMEGNSETNTQLSAQITALEAAMLKADKALQTSLANARSSVKSLNSKVAVLARKGAAKDPTAIARLNKIDTAIRAIDGSRAQVNKEIQRLKTRVNKIQLQLQ